MWILKFYGDAIKFIFSPEESSDAGLLVNIGSSQQNEAKTTIQSSDFTKLVDIESSSLNMSNENFLINVDSVNSNILSSEKSYSGFDECLQKKSDATVAGNSFFSKSVLLFSLNIFFIKQPILPIFKDIHYRNHIISILHEC